MSFSLLSAIFSSYIYNTLLELLHRLVVHKTHIIGCTAKVACRGVLQFLRRVSREERRRLGAICLFVPSRGRRGIPASHARPGETKLGGEGNPNKQGRGIQTSEGGKSGIKTCEGESFICNYLGARGVKSFANLAKSNPQAGDVRVQASHVIVLCG